MAILFKDNNSLKIIIMLFASRVLKGERAEWNERSNDPVSVNNELQLLIKLKIKKVCHVTWL